MFIENCEGPRLDEEFLPFEMGYLPPKFQRKAEIELGESPEKIEEGMKLLREMVEKDKNFDGYRSKAVDEFLLQILRHRKFNVSRTFSQMQTCLRFVKKNREMFVNIEYKQFSGSNSNKILTFLPRRCPEGCAILVFDLDRWNPEELPVENLKKLILVVLVQAIRDPMTQVNGFKVIVNAKSNPLRHLRYCTPSNIYLLFYGTQECVPGRFKGIHVVNESLAVKTAWMFASYFLSEKIKKRFTFHSSPETLLHHFPRAVLPIEYGGDLEPQDMTWWLKKVTKPEYLAYMTLDSRPVPSF